MRDPSSIDYSEPIFDWLRNSKDKALKKWECIINGELQQKQKAVLGNVSTSQLPQFQAVDMHMARFCDLKFKLGAGYLYCHQVQCLLPQHDLFVLYFTSILSNSCEVYFANLYIITRLP